MKFSGAGGFAAGSVFALVLAGGAVAAAATGDYLVLGKSNAEGRTTVISSAHGTPLSLQPKAGVAPFAVSNSVRVSKLNSDKLDGLSASAFARSTGQTGVISAVSQPVDVDDDGTMDALAAYAACPAGTMVTGGGSENFTATGFTLADEPMDGGWIALSTYDPAQDTADDVTAYVVCYNPLGAVRGATSLVAHKRVSLQTAATRAFNKR